MDQIQPFRIYNLNESRQSHSSQTPFSHQNQALEKIRNWLETVPKSNAGGIVVLPTGGGKTFTAIRFICTSVIPKSYKVLWLAHTHHLLDQAFRAFEKSVATIPEPKSTLSTRVVSGTPSHHHVHKVEPTDDVVVATLQTITLAYQVSHPSLQGFLNAAGDKLCVVFDEAHHAPAPSYRNLLKAMRANHSDMLLIGLTATPTNSNPKKSGWLRELFPQGIIHQSDARTLIADGILSRPNFEKIPTNIAAEFDESDYAKWVETYRDLPETVIEALAKNRDRNLLIAGHYVNHRKRYGKTIIFAERWHQCVQIEAFLERQGIRAGSVFSMADATPSTVEARNARKSDENHRTLEKFRNGEIDVLLNVKMLTEGTDVPQTQTVFVTRQTTSTILLTQMVGRALRGPRAGGTQEAFIVSFEDNWKQKINWAGFDQLGVEPIPDEVEVIRTTRLVQMISIDLVRRLADQMDSGVNVAPSEFLKLMPIGWYQVEFEAIVDGTEEVETVRHLVMVFEDQVEGYENFFNALQVIDLSLLSSERVTFEDAEAIVNRGVDMFFPNQLDEITRIEPKDFFDLMRHVAQNDREMPSFFPFSEREGYDLDTVANQHLNERLDLRAIHERLSAEFERTDRFWKSLYPRYQLFKTQYDACINRILNGPPPQPVILNLPTESDEDEGSEPTEKIKKFVKARDGKRCLCCGETRRRLQIDHIAARYFGGRNLEENLQTLCKLCNQDKGISHINFRIFRNESIVEPPSSFPLLSVPANGYETFLDMWIQTLQRGINFFYRAAAVEEIRIGAKGRAYYEWIIRLHAGNRPEWLLPHLPGILDTIRSIRSGVGVGGPEGLRVLSPDFTEAAHFISHEGGDGLSDFLQLPNGSECRIIVDGENLHESVLLRQELKFGNLSPFTSFAEAYKSMTGRPRHNWKGWEFRYPNSTEWIRGDEARSHLSSSITSE
jgi:ATP-dependent helicase IRC3